MICKVCGFSNGAKNVNHKRLCLNCNMHMVPHTETILEQCRKKWGRMRDDIINGHKHGTWADQADAFICYMPPVIREEIHLVHY